MTRLGYGDAQRRKDGDGIKEAIGDALRNAGMRFGAALDLWHKGELHGDDEEEGKGSTPPTSVKEQTTKQPPKETPKATPQASQQGEKPITEAQKRFIYVRLGQSEVVGEDDLKQTFGVDHLTDLLMSQMNEVLSYIESGMVEGESQEVPF